MPERFKGTVCKTVIRWFDSNYGLCDCSSVVEHRLVVSSVVGSNPISHPKYGSGPNGRGHRLESGWL